MNEAKASTNINDLCFTLDAFSRDNQYSKDPKVRWLANEMEAVFRKASAVRGGNTLYDADAVSFLAFRRAEIAKKRDALRKEIAALDGEENALPSTLATES